MWSIFKRKSNEPSVDDLASNTDETLETLKKKSDYLEQNIANFQLQAKNAAKTDKKKALKFLKKKKASEAELEQIDKYILQLQDVQRTTEQSKLTAMVATSTKIAHRIIEKTLKETNIDSMADSMAEYLESKDKLAELDLLMEQNVQSQNIDDDELERELEELEQEELNQALTDVIIPSLPSAPTVKIPTPVSNVEEDENALTAQQLRDWAQS